MRLAIIYLILFFVTPTWAAPYTRTAPNLLSDSKIDSKNHWYLKHASHTRSVSRDNDGSGSIQLKKSGLAIGPKVKVVPGRTYTCGLYFKGHAKPTTFMRLSLKINNSKGKFLRHAKSASHWGYAKANQWQEAVVIYQAKSGDGEIRIFASRPSKSPNTSSTIWIDDVYCGEGVSFDQPKSAKTPFTGGLVKVNASGSVSIKQQNGAFEREFLRCMFVDQKRKDWSLYGANDFNCNMWVASLRQLTKGVKAGLPYGFFCARAIRQRLGGRKTKSVGETDSSNPRFALCRPSRGILF